MTDTATTDSAASAASAVTDRSEHSLAHLPVTLFASVMGLGGVSLAWRRAAGVWDLPQWPWLTFLALAAVGHLAATVVILSIWFSRNDIGQTAMTPAWFIPVVGNVITPLAADRLGSVELAWFSFGVGVVFWLGLLPLLLHRVLLHDPPLPARLLPTIAIFIAPPAVAMLSWQALTGVSDGPVVRVLYSAAVVFVLLLAAQLPRLRSLPFGLPVWAYTFPLAAASAAAISMAGVRPQMTYDVVAAALLTVATVLVLAVAALTLGAAGRREICVPE